ncbi:hypothetical protein ALO_19617 [Acetonema longum DSM 6540]|uniref:Uncharacterized protein n=1 Tax=Acetonema longum DSM 6540 TaxID=1009370 RepID=F7NP80_9FIRM|nr:hypothetical protein ALO_19617 [Acetonema longum DSM 6540]
MCIRYKIKIALPDRHMRRLGSFFVIAIEILKFLMHMIGYLYYKYFLKFSIMSL